jgi:hypothetical protein
MLQWWHLTAESDVEAAASRQPCCTVVSLQQKGGSCEGVGQLEGRGGGAWSK